MRFTHTLSYHVAPSDVHRMLADPAFREKVCEAMDASRRNVSVEPAGEAMTVLVDQTQPARSIPSFAKRVVGEEMRIVQRESWTDASSASLSISMPGKPGTFEGTVALVPDGAGTVEKVAGEVRVKVPIIGGRLEALVGDLLRAALRTEERVGRAWLAGER